MIIQKGNSLVYVDCPDAQGFCEYLGISGKFLVVRPVGTMCTWYSYSL